MPSEPLALFVLFFFMSRALKGVSCCPVSCTSGRDQWQRSFNSWSGSELSLRKGPIYDSREVQEKKVCYPLAREELGKAGASLSPQSFKKRSWETAIDALK